MYKFSPVVNCNQQSGRLTFVFVIFLTHRIYFQNPGRFPKRNFSCPFCRYLAVTRPISYAKRDNIRRIQLSIATVWIVSLIISLPIVCGLNTVNSYDPTMCQSRNAVYIVTSSIGSFYLPAVVLIVLYHRIFAVIRQRHKMLEQTTGKRLYSGSGTTEWLGDLSQSVCLGLYTAPDENNASPKPGTNLTFPPVEPNECGARDSVQITSNPYTMRRLSEIELFDKTVQAAERLYPNPNGHSNKSPAKHRSSHLNQSLSLPELFFQGESVSRLYPTKNSTIKSKSVDLLFFKPPVNSSRLSSSTLNQRSKCSSVCNSPGSKCDLKHPSGTHSQFASAVLSHTSSESLGNTFDSTVHVYTNHCVASSEHMHCTHIQPGECPCPYHVCCYEYSCVSTEKESTRGKRMSYRKRPATNSVNCCFRAPISSDDSSPVFSGPNISDLLAFSFSDMSNGEFDTSTLRQYESSRSDYIHCECCCPATCQAIKPIERWSGEFTAGTNQIRRNKSAQKRMLMQQRQDYKDAKSNPGLSPWNRMLALQIPLKRKLVSDNMPKTDRKYDPIMSINQEREWARCVRISESGNKDYSKSRKRSASVSRRANLDTVFINFQTFWKQAAEKNTRQTTQTESGGSFQNTYIKTETIPDGEQNSGGKVKDSGSRTARYAKFWVSKQRSLSNREKKAMKTLVIVLGEYYFNVYLPDACHV